MSVETSVITNNDLLSMWKEQMVYKRLAEQTIMANLFDVKKFFEEIKKPAAEITKRIIEGYVHGMTKENGKEMNIATKAKCQSHIKNFYNWLYSSDEPEINEMLVYIDKNGNEKERKNPVTNWEYVLATRDAKAERNERKEGLTENETKIFLKTVKQYMLDCGEGTIKKVLAHRDYAMVLLMLELGLRSSDVINLNKDNFDFTFESKTLNYIVQKTKDERHVVVSDELADALMEYWDLRDDDIEIAFISEHGKRMANNKINKRLTKYANMSGIEKSVTCHILRHTCGALIYTASNGNIMLTREVLGHKSINVTQIYAYNRDMDNKIAEQTSDLTKKIIV